jgi:hypothetical protein
MAAGVEDSGFEKKERAQREGAAPVIHRLLELNREEDGGA